MRRALTEERSRYCAFAGCLRPLLEEETALVSEFQQLEEVNQRLRRHTDEPLKLPQASEQVRGETHFFVLRKRNFLFLVLGSLSFGRTQCPPVFCAYFFHFQRRKEKVGNCCVMRKFSSFLAHLGAFSPSCSFPCGQRSGLL